MKLANIYAPFKDTAPSHKPIIWISTHTNLSTSNEQYNIIFIARFVNNFSRIHKDS